MFGRYRLYTYSPIDLSFTLQALRNRWRGQFQKWGQKGFQGWKLVDSNPRNRNWTPHGGLDGSDRWLWWGGARTWRRWSPWRAWSPGRGWLRRRGTCLTWLTCWDWTHGRSDQEMIMGDPDQVIMGEASWWNWAKRPRRGMRPWITAVGLVLDQIKLTNTKSWSGSRPNQVDQIGPSWSDQPQSTQKEKTLPIKQQWQWVGHKD